MLGLHNTSTSSTPTTNPTTTELPHNYSHYNDAPQTTIPTTIIHHTETTMRSQSLLTTNTLTPTSIHNHTVSETGDSTISSHRHTGPNRTKHHIRSHTALPSTLTDDSIPLLAPRCDSDTEEEDDDVVTPHCLIRYNHPTTHRHQSRTPEAPLVSENAAGQPQPYHEQSHF